MTAEELLVKRAKAGDESAFAEIVRAYEKAVYNSALYLSKNEEDALDISQEVFIKLWRTLGSFRGEASLKTWIARLTRNCAIDYLRSRRQRDTLQPTYDGEGENGIDVADDDVAADPVKSFERNERVAAVRRAVDSVEEPLRETLILREFQGLSYAEIAQALGVSEGTVKSRVSRGRERVKEFLKMGNYF
jgi:RNA polymerase sigma-70 factor (ECF subfamily)